MFRKIKPYFKGLIVTAEKRRLIAFDGNNIYKGEENKTKVADLTGAGDAFGSGFVSTFIKTNNIEKSLQFASANAAACVQKWGAKEGLLKKGQKYQKVKVKVSKL